MTNLDCFIDTNILVYAFDADGSEKHIIARNLVKKTWLGEKSFYISNQVLAEFSRTMLQKVKKPVSASVMKEIISLFQISHWIILSYSLHSIISALELQEQYSISFWDALIVSTMKEKGIRKIYTEDAGFKNIPEIISINPFKDV